MSPALVFLLLVGCRTAVTDKETAAGQGDDVLDTTDTDTDTAPSPDADGDGFTSSGGDCDDSDPAIHPGVEDVCNGVDDDCDGATDPGCLPTTTVRVSLTSDGAEAVSSMVHSGYVDEWGSVRPAISADGTFVAFGSWATNLDPTSSEAGFRVFRHDARTGETLRLDGLADVRSGHHDERLVTLSADGGRAAFRSQATLTATDLYSGEDIFFVQIDTGTTTLLSVAADGTPNTHGSHNPSISGAGDTVVFETLGPELIPGDTADTEDVLVSDTSTAGLSSPTVGGGLAEYQRMTPAISSDGTTICFVSERVLDVADVDTVASVYVYDRGSGVFSVVSVPLDGTGANGTAWQCALSSDGQTVAFTSEASNLVSGDENLRADVFVFDRAAGTLERVSVPEDAVPDPKGGWAYFPSISGDGRYVTFVTYDAFVADDTNGLDDVYLRDRIAGTTVRVSVASDGTDPDGSSGEAVLSADGAFVAFMSTATNLVADDTNAEPDVFLTPRP